MLIDILEMITTISLWWKALSSGPVIYRRACEGEGEGEGEGDLVVSRY